MSIKLPEPIENYLRHSEGGDIEKAAATFAPEATVFDEGEDTEVVGREAIHHWMTEYTSKYKTTLEVVGLIEKDGEVVLTTLVSGNFPGSPAEFEYRFALHDGLISRLTIEFVAFK
ncbi:nuclear transport factor 2 family protein [bacterium]|nr:MAG: nuclear transport factor 2 family protein [bacterium]